MKYEIMLRILFELLSKKTVKASYLAQKYEVSVRSIHRYINELELAGVPIYTTRGNTGGFSIVDTYRLPTTFLTEQEFEQTINALNAITDSVPNMILDSTINKLKSAVKNNTSGFDIKSGGIIIDAGPWGDTVNYKAKLVIIQKCLENCKKLSITYHDRNGEVTKRVIEPHVIVFKQGLWYVYAYCNLRKKFRFFKTGRIEQATILDDKFIKQDLSKMDLPLNFWHSSVVGEDIVMEIDKSCLSDVEEWLGIENISSMNGKFIASVNLPFDNGLVSKIMSYGKGIKVLEPKILKDELVSQAKSILNKYE